MENGTCPPPEKNDADSFLVPLEFILDHLQPYEPILFWKFINFSTFILGGQFLLPQRANNWKMEHVHLQKRMMQIVYSALGVHTGLGLSKFYQ